MVVEVWHRDLPPSLTPLHRGGGGMAQGLTPSLTPGAEALGIREALGIIFIVSSMAQLRIELQPPNLSGQTL